ncbi:MAG: PstS family phosphate ABC transporter substrate-binding protein [Isosphaeraceae bacterium]
MPRPRLRPAIALIPAILALAWSMCGCSGTGTGGVSAPVVVEGSSTVYRISQAAQIDFKKAQPDIKVLVSGKGTGPGFGRYLRGETDIVDASRDAQPSESKEAEEKGLPWTRLLVGYDGITVVVPRSNDFVTALSVAQLKALLEPDAKAETWKDLDPSWPDRKVKLFTPDDDSGTFEFFNEAIHGKKKEQRKKGVQMSADDNTLVSGVAGEADGLGYFGYAYAVKNKSRLRIVPVRNGHDAEPVEPNPETILQGTYKPLSRPLYLFVKNEAYLKRPEVRAFVDYYLQNIDALTTKADYVPPTESDKAANRAALEALATPGNVQPPA